MCARWNERNQTNQYRTIETIVRKGNFGIGNTRIGNKVLVGGEIIKPDLGLGPEFFCGTDEGTKSEKGSTITIRKSDGDGRFRRGRRDKSDPRKPSKILIAIGGNGAGPIMRNEVDTRR